MKTFKKWLLEENNDIFGFDKKNQNQKITTTDEDMPLDPITADVVLETMLKKEIEGKIPFSDFHDQIQWGENIGAVRMNITPLGSYKSIIRKLQYDLEGTPQWICKKIIPYKELSNTNDIFDEVVADEVFEKIEEIYKKEEKHPSENYSNLANLTVKVANECNKKTNIPEIFVFTGFKEVKKNENYLILYECKGHGVEAPGSMRLEEFIIDMSYNKKTGIIRSLGYTVQSPTRQHLWQIQPSEWDENFLNSQNDNEICHSIAAALSTF